MSVQAFAGRVAARAATRRWAVSPFTLVTVALYAMLVVAPLLFMLFASFRGPGSTLPLSPRATTTVANYPAVFNTSLLRTLGDTAIYVGGSLALAVLIGVPLAWLLERTDLPGRRFLGVLMFAPMIIPGISGAQIWSLMLGEQFGVLNQVIRVFLPWIHEGPFKTTNAVGMVFAQGMTSLPMVVLFLSTAFRNMDASLEEASRLSGAGMFRTLHHITLKLTRPAIASCALLMTVSLLGSFEIPLVFGLGQGLTPIGVRLYTLLYPPADVPQYGYIAAYSVFLTAVSFALITLYSRQTRASDAFATIGGKGMRAGTNHLGLWRWPTAFVVMVFLTLTIGLQLIVLVWQSFFPSLDDIGISRLVHDGSFAAYRSLFNDGDFWRSVRLTAMIALVSAVVTTVLPVALAWIVVRFKGSKPVRAILDLMGSTSVGIPSPVAAFAFFLLFLGLNRWLPLYNTTWALGIAYCFRLGYSYRFGSAALIQISKELEEASVMSGASRFDTFRRILLPLVVPTVAFLFVLQIITALQEFAVPMMVRVESARPLSVYAFNKMTGQEPMQAAAVGVLLVAAILLVAAVVGLATARARPRR